MNEWRAVLNQQDIHELMEVSMTVASTRFAMRAGVLWMKSGP